MTTWVRLSHGQTGSTSPKSGLGGVSCPCASAGRAFINARAARTSTRAGRPGLIEQWKFCIAIDWAVYTGLTAQRHGVFPIGDRPGSIRSIWRRVLSLVPVLDLEGD